MTELFPISVFRKLLFCCLTLGLISIISLDVPAQSLCVATYNLNYGNRRGDQVVDAITLAAPDLICFQETTTQSEQFLRDRLGKSYPFFHAVGHQGKYFAERFAIASKTKLSNVEFVPPTQGLFGFYLATVEFGGQEIQIVNVHLTPFQSNPKDGLLGAMTALAATEKTHDVEIASIVRRVDPKRPTIVLGDFNSLSSFVAPTRLRELGFKDAFAELNSDPDSHHTWSWPAKPIPISLRIDYVFHTNHFIAKKSEIVRKEGSDHSLLYAKLDLANSAVEKAP